MCAGKVNIISQLYPTIKLGDLVIGNGLILNSNTLELGNSLTRDTLFTGNFKFEIGNSGNRVSQVNLSSNNQLLLDYNNGTNGINIKLDSNGAIITDTQSSPKGLQGAADYSANYTNNTYTQKVYVDSRLVGKQISAVLSNPTITQDGYFVQWDNTSGKFTLSASGFTAPGSDTQIIFKDGSTLGANNKFTFNKTTGTLTSGDTFILGTSGVSGASKNINVQGTDTNISLTLTTKGTGNLIFALSSTASIVLGLNSDNNSNRSITLDGSASNIDLNLVTKGTDAKVNIGDTGAAGSFRYLSVSGATADISMVLQPKGAGNIILDGNVSLGLSSEANTSKTIKALTSGSTCDIVLLPFGASGAMVLGDTSVNYTDFYIKTNSTSTNRNLRLNGNGSGVVVIDGYAYKRMTIGTWNMYAAGAGLGTTLIGHGVTNYTTIEVLFVSIFADGVTSIFKPLNCVTGASSTVPQGGVMNIDSANITLARLTGGGFDNSSYSSNAQNRGYITFRYQI